MLTRILYTLSAGTMIGWLCLGPFFWMLRDGLGPGSSPSSGLEAVSRFFFTFYFGPIALVLIGLTAFFRFRVHRVDSKAPTS